MLTYDERALGERLVALSQSELVAFAAACAERLMPAFIAVASESASEVVERVRAALDLAWSSSASQEQVEQATADIEALVPDEDDESVGPHIALVQSAIASVVYALRVRLSLSVQDAVWVARQLYETADFIVQRGAAHHSYVSDVDREAPVQLVLRGLESALRDAKRGSLSLLRSGAEADGQGLLASYLG